jgi:hypothetical protein
MLSLLGLDPEVYDLNSIGDRPNPMTQERLEVLFNGSILRGSGRVVDVKDGAHIAQMIPWLAIVGGCFGNVMSQGRIAVHPMILACEENKARLEIIDRSLSKQINSNESILENFFDAEKPSRYWLQQQNFTHNDDFNRLGSGAMRMLPPAQKAELLANKVELFENKQEIGWQDKDAGNHVQMRFSVETIGATASFFWRIDTFDLTPLMESAFRTTFAHFLSRPYIGGMRRMGMGLIDVEWIGRHRVDAAKGSFSKAVATENISELYYHHLESNREDILQVLQAIAK